MKTTLSCLLLLCIFSLSWAQTSYRLNGNITLEGESAIGAKIVLVGTEIGAYADIEGDFELHSPLQEGRLAVSLIGAVTQIVAFDASTSNIQLELLPQVLELEQVEILAYMDIRRIDNPVCHPHRHCCDIMVATIEENLFMSDPAILNSAQSQLSIARQGDNLLARFMQAPLGSQANLSFNEMPLDQKAEGLFRFLWEASPQQIIVENPNDAILSQGVQSLGGNISFNSFSVRPNKSDINYRGLAGISFSSGERQNDFSHQEHHLRLSQYRTEKKFNTQAGFDFVSRPNYRSDSQWQLYSANLGTRLNLDKVQWHTQLLAANMQSVGEHDISDRNQIAILSQRMHWRVNDKLRLNLNQISQLSHRADSLRQYHALRAKADFYTPQWPKLFFKAQYDLQQSVEQINQAFAASATYQLPKEIALVAGLRQDHFFPQADLQNFGATTISASIGRHESHCAPSRLSFQYETAVILIPQNRIWFNSISTTWEITNNGSLRLQGQVHANRFAERQAIDLCWLQWDGQGPQTQLGGSINLLANHRFNDDWSLFSQTTYSYNQSFVSPTDPTTAASSRSGPTGGHPTAWNNELGMPKGMFSSLQKLSYKAWSLKFNTWAWLQNDPNAALANGLRLQETRLSWDAPSEQIYHKLKKVKVSLQGNNLLQWTDGNRQDFDQLAYRYAQDSFNPTAYGKQILLGLEVAL